MKLQQQQQQIKQRIEFCAMVETTTLVTIFLVITVFLLTLMLLLIPMALFRGHRGKGSFFG